MCVRVIVYLSHAIVLGKAHVKKLTYYNGQAYKSNLKVVRTTFIYGNGDKEL